MFFGKKLILYALILGLGTGCTRINETKKSTDKPATKAPPALVKCTNTGIPLIEAIYSAEGVPLWELGQPFPKKNRFFDAIEIKGQNLCSGNLTMADGFTPAIPLPYSVLPNGNLKIPIPWELQRITQSLLFRTHRSFTRIDFHFVPVDKLSRQIFIRGMKNEVFR